MDKPRVTILAKIRERALPCLCAGFHADCGMCRERWLLQRVTEMETALRNIGCEPQGYGGPKCRGKKLCRVCAPLAALTEEAEDARG